jgi:hypothetical protein
MTEQEEHFIHFSACVAWLNNAWRLLQAVRDQPTNSLIGPAFRFALIEYGKPYKLSRGILKSRKLDTRFIPPALLALHQRIIDSRDQVHAHSDLTLMEAKLSVHDFIGQRYTLIAQNKITGTEEFSKLAEVIALIEGTLDNMYSEEKLLEAALPN